VPKKYDIELHPSVDKFLTKIRERQQAKNIADAIESLSVDPRPNGCKKLVDSDGAWRIRVGDYRVVYDIYDSKLLVLVIDVGHRKEVYRRR
jgi:mRNA interferase RelE/StbE